jgi:hypothetical protein
MNPYPIGAVQILSIIGSAALLAFLFYLMRRKKLKVEYALLWIIIFAVFLFIAVFRGVIDYISRFLGIQYQPAALFIILIAACFLLMLHFSVVISDLRAKINTLIMTVSLLEEKISKLPPPP